MKNFLRKLDKFVKSLFSFEVEEDVHKDMIIVEEEDPHAFHIETEEIEPEIKVKDIPETNIDFEEDLFEDEIELEDNCGQCCNCCHFCKYHEDDVLGHCKVNDEDMVEDDGCVDFESK